MVTLKCLEGDQREEALPCAHQGARLARRVLLDYATMLS